METIPTQQSPEVMPQETTPKVRVYVHPLTFVERHRRRGPSTHADFSYCINYLSAHEQRNRTICDQVLADLELGNKVIIPVARVSHVHALTNMINSAVEQEVAIGVYGSVQTVSETVKRNEVIARIESGECQVLVVTLSLFDCLGFTASFNILYNVIPSSAISVLRREVSRLALHREGTLLAVRLFVDTQVAPSSACFIRTYKNAQQLKLEPTGEAQAFFKQIVSGYVDALKAAKTA